MKHIFTYLKPYAPAMALGLFIKFAGTVMDLFLPWILSYLIDVIVPKESIGQILLYGGLMLLCAVIAWVGNVTANRMASKVARDTTEQLRHDLFAKISLLSCEQTDDFTVASLESRLTSDTYHTHQMISMVQRMGVRAPILLLGGIAMTLFLEPVLALVMLGVLPLVLFTAFFISRKGISLFGNVQRTVDRMVRVVRENAAGIRVIKALSKTDYEKKRFFEVNEQVVAAEEAANVTMAASGPLMNLFLNTGLTLVVAVGAFRVFDGKTQTGTILAFLTYFTIILNAVLAINRIFVMVSKGTASAKRIGQVLDAPEDLAVWPQAGQEMQAVQEKQAAQEMQAEKAEKEPPAQIQFQNVSFTYHKGRSNVLTDISFSLKKGETLGIIGPTGSGKSTLIQLLLRFYDVDQGAVFINGKNIKTIPTETLRTKFGVVFQNDVLFADSIKENVNFGRNLEEEALKDALCHAQAWEFVQKLEAGWEHGLSIRGANLSGGQRQRLLISRALAAQPEILILDDASSALDYQTDAKLRQALQGAFGNTTTVIVAQRVSAIKHADCILVLDKGTVIGCGRHEALMETCDFYRTISLSQMGGNANGR